MSEIPSTDRFKNLHALIIEDDLILTLSLELMLKKMGFTSFQRAESGEAAIECVNNHKPDLMLVDIYLGPGISGIEAVKRIQEKDPIPVIYITGNSDEQHRELARQTDYEEYLVKPVTFSQVRTTIGKIASKRLNG